jgi:lysozyme
MIWDRESVPALAPTLTTKFESNILHPYRDGGGVFTIGVGSTFMPDGSRVTAASRPITAAESLALLSSQQRRWVPVVASAVTVPIDEVVAAVLIDFTHNEGPAALPGSTIAQMLNAGKLELAMGQLNGWVIAKGQIVLGLMRRREAERQVALGIALPGSAYAASWAMTEADLMPAYEIAIQNARLWRNP